VIFELKIGTMVTRSGPGKHSVHINFSMLFCFCIKRPYKTDRPPDGQNRYAIARVPPTKTAA